MFVRHTQVIAAKVMDYIEGLSKEEILGVTLNLYHFPDQDFCVCPRCTEKSEAERLKLDTMASSNYHRVP